jgi:preprotein translocase subunit SecF
VENQKLDKMNKLVISIFTLFFFASPVTFGEEAKQEDLDKKSTKDVKVVEGEKNETAPDFSKIREVLKNDNLDQYVEQQKREEEKNKYRIMKIPRNEAKSYDWGNLSRPIRRAKSAIEVSI